MLITLLMIPVISCSGIFDAGLFRLVMPYINDRDLVMLSMRRLLAGSSEARQILKELQLAYSLRSVEEVVDELLTRSSENLQFVIDRYRGERVQVNRLGFMSEGGRQVKNKRRGWSRRVLHDERMFRDFKDAELQPDLADLLQVMKHYLAMHANPVMRGSYLLPDFLRERCNFESYFRAVNDTFLASVEEAREAYPEFFRKLPKLYKVLGVISRNRQSRIQHQFTSQLFHSEDSVIDAKTGAELCLSYKDAFVIPHMRIFVKVLPDHGAIALWYKGDPQCFPVFTQGRLVSIVYRESLKEVDIWVHHQRGTFERFIVTLEGAPQKFRDFQTHAVDDEVVRRMREQLNARDMSVMLVDGDHDPKKIKTGSASYTKLMRIPSTNLAVVVDSTDDLIKKEMIKRLHNAPFSSVTTPQQRAWKRVARAARGDANRAWEYMKNEITGDLFSVEEMADQLEKVLRNAPYLELKRIFDDLAFLPDPTAVDSFIRTASQEPIAPDMSSLRTVAHIAFQFRSMARRALQGADTNHLQLAIQRFNAEIESSIPELKVMFQKIRRLPAMDGFKETADTFIGDSSLVQQIAKARGQFFLADTEEAVGKAAALSQRLAFDLKTKMAVDNVE